MALPKIIADFSCILASDLDVGGETSSISINVDRDGVALPDGRYYFTIDGDLPAKEYITCTKTGTTLSDIKTVSRQGEEVAGVLRMHKVGALVELTDFATYKRYMDDIAIQATPNATATVIGASKLSVAPVADPISVGTNDPRVPTADPTTLFAPIGLISGIVWPYAGASAPTGWLMCDGQAVSRTTYSGLFAVISTTFGVGDGSTTFNVPNLKGRSIIGAGTAATKVATFVSRASNVITVSGISDTANNEFQTGQAVLYSAPSGAMTGLTHNTTYYLIRTGNLTFSLATSLANAQNGTVISLSSNGTGTQTFTLTLTARTLGHTGGEENHAMSSTEMLAHTHGLPTPTSGSGNGNFLTNGTPNYTLTYVDKSASKGGNAAMNNMQPFVALNYIIKT